MEIIQEFIADRTCGRIDHYLVGVCKELSRSRIQALIKQGGVLLNDRPARASEAIAVGDRIRVRIPASTPPENLQPANIPLEILFEDDAFLVINKGPDMVVHPGSGTGGETLVHALLHHCADLSGIGGVQRPGIVHRLDKETSGCIVVAKSDEAHRALAAQFAGRTVRKKYLAVVRGIPHRPHGTIEAAIARHPVHRQKMAVSEHPSARAARTDYEKLAEGPKISLIACVPHTGRTHQIRVHLKHLGFPILGDPLYGQRGTFTRHYLHAWKLAFAHPITGAPMEFVAPVPDDFPLHPPPGR